MQLRKESHGDESKEGTQIFNEQAKFLKGRHNYSKFLRKFAVLNEELKCDPDEFDLNFYTYGLKLYGNLPLIEPLETRETEATCLLLSLWKHVRQLRYKNLL